MNSAHAIDLDISGFSSFIGGYSEKGTDYLQYFKDNLDYQPDSLVGIQVSGRINDKATATVQITSKALDQWDTSADWAYITYQPRSDFTWKLGRFRGPFFLYSENIQVGYTYPWITPPYSVYNIPFTSTEPSLDAAIDGNPIVDCWLAFTTGPSWNIAPPPVM